MLMNSRKKELINKMNSKTSKIVLEKNNNVKGIMARVKVLELAKTLSITHKDGVIIVNDNKMQKVSGNNNSPKILKVDNLLQGDNLFNKTKNATKISIDLFTNNGDRCTKVKNKDTKTIFEIGKSGIKKTFNNNTSEEKANTCFMLKRIGEEAIYYQTTMNLNEQNILYHHFLTPIKSYNVKYELFVRCVVKEYLDRNDLNNKFYYHQFEYLCNEKVECFSNKQTNS